jgi:hypothetical protein
MLPARWQLLAALRKNPNGKIDRSAVQEMFAQARTAGTFSQFHGRIPLWSPDLGSSRALKPTRLLGANPWLLSDRCNACEIAAR